MLASFLKRIAVLGDKSAIVLIVPALAALYYIDQAMAMTLIQWLIFAPVLAGVAIHISRIVFPQLSLNNFFIEAEKGNVACGVVAASIILFVSLIVLALVIWAKA